MSHCDRIILALRDGKWHTSMALYMQVGHCVLHSRISDLRKKGHNVQGQHVPGKTGAEGYEYRLVYPSPTGSSPGEVRASSTDSGAQLGETRRGGRKQVGRPIDHYPLMATAAQQLSLYVAPQHYDI